MIIRFNKELSYEFEMKNFTLFVGSTGLYFIFLRDLLIPYPFKNSYLIYIGMSESRLNSIGNRLKDHLSGRSKNKGILGYYKKWKLKFTYLDYEFLKHIFVSNKIEAIETYFLEDFSNEFGSYPICNNKRGSSEEIPILMHKPKVQWGFFGDNNEK
jgi:hypothetical protein